MDIAEALYNENVCLKEIFSVEIGIDYSLAMSALLSHYRSYRSVFHI
jgi:hypothetical protein